MGCGHGNGSPSECSQCRGVPARVVDRDEMGRLRVDGVPVDRPELITPAMNDHPRKKKGWR